MAISSRFERFLNNIQLTDLQVEDAQRKIAGIRETLSLAYYGNNYSGRGFLIGSYGKRTAIRPPSDLDFMFVLPEEVKDRLDGNWFSQRNRQSELLQEIRSKLVRGYPRTDVSADRQVVEVSFGSYKVEVVPCFKNSFYSGYTICDAKNGGKWTTAYPDNEAENLTTSNKRSSGNTIRLIKMLKAWGRNCNVPLKSIALELLAIDFLSSWEHYDKTSVYFDWMVRDFFKYLIRSKVNGYLTLPGSYETLYLGDSWKSRAESALARSLKAIDHESEELTYASSEEWRKVFGDDFPYPLDSERTSTKVKANPWSLLR